jgi:hypothetical protein
MTLLSYFSAGVRGASAGHRVVFPSSYSVYPFLSPRPLPLTMKSGGAFRIRRVFEWLNGDGHEDTQATGGLASGMGKIFGVDECVSHR